jgi:hypothetical protein
MSKTFNTIVAAAVYFTAGSIIATKVAADASGAVDTSKLKTALSPLVELLQKMAQQRLAGSET